MTTHNTKGFTLIELMITVAIVGILSSIAMPAYSGYVAKARFTEVINLISDLKRRVEECALTENTLEAICQCAGGEEVGRKMAQSRYIKELSIYTGSLAGEPLRLWIYFSPDWENLGIDGRTYWYPTRTPHIKLFFTIDSIDSTGRIAWRCLTSGEPKKNRPLVALPFAKLLDPTCYDGTNRGSER